MAGEARKSDDSRNSQVIYLLNELGDRLIRSEKERFTVRAELADAREILSALENRAEQTERIFLTIQDRINKQASIETLLLTRQEELERLTFENTARLERTEALTGKIEEAIILQNRMARRLERSAQDKARILSKIERIEASIEDARDVLGGVVEARAAKTVIPQPANGNASAATDKWWTTSVRSRLVLAASVVVGSALMVLAVSQLVAHWPQTKTGVGFSDASVSATAVPRPTTPGVSTQGQLSTDENELANFNAGSINEDQILAQMETNPDAVAERLNRIEPGNSSATVITPQGQLEKTAALSSSAVKIDPASQVELQAEPTITPAADVKTSKGDVDAFIKGAIDTSRPLSDRIKPDATLPPVIKQVEIKAFEGVPEAQHDLAAIYTAGHGGVEVNYSKAAAWFREAAVNGIANARYNLGVLYHQGLGVDRDVNRAINWYRAAAGLGHPEAKYNLGIAYIEGIGTEYNPRIAADFFQAAAQGGVMEAAYNLGLIHENGLLGDPDMNEAVYWYKIASDHNPEARVAYNQIVKAMSLKPADVARVITEYSAVYGLDGDGHQVAKAAGVQEKKNIAVRNISPTSSSSGMVAALPLRAVDQNMPEALTLGDIPPLTAEETKSLLELDVNKDHALVSQVQEQLMRMGLYPGPADGVGGPQTEDAIRAYQSRNKMPVSGKASEDLLVHMLSTELNTAAGGKGVNQ